MIEITEGRAVLEFLDRAASRAGQHGHIAIVSPFIDDDMSARLAHLARLIVPRRCTLSISTSPAAADRLARYLRKPLQNPHVNVAVRPALHAKVYAAFDRHGTHGEAIVTSANLTRAGAATNIELGVRVSSTSLAGRRLLRQVRDFVRRTAG